ncbi:MULTISPECIES: 16S rRNA (guanine(527)-N(7))-methyltransferase RsmG [Chromohalobacter]|uniref:Ribosomal RNA small subunit methyltransferase G n=1 Tax=Chromohalobacter israelensis (strain ATCC BAA-138 / DSM 3043 / CIP 106854 / NCIMB 13768 / 1H11) TaxID=290398 RepID=RSMG_CHRI1|nr:16S rRNA (guanine(527)-N(7))-methyltransferase RsmG [Chromohalobacter salexigens]Q1QSC0.1 RecName: Full=Ribosomal RNA small subunit methyltransferase G; AltName: Full=16S rRNA 7-methylguanosine methyltransferase; Short=16S rRNA m7G methyltransferase [Chromohalobacter salexigens DSM 3043]ABE60638.1 16S rRNA m(7)G-527 methyltransferase [Chromohalobacter salexigens DSM 3043]MBZ5875176.1 16S rRNA (guanine(527)-N(7))-methyltransferase RsmG [Chromohalobacter salexigens]
MTPACEARLDAGLAELGLEVDATARERLLALLALLHKWNRAYNLTAVRDPEQMVTRHLLDSASVATAVRGPRLLDVGAGAGLPGLVLAILDPSLEVTMLDGNGKKVRFQRQAVLELGLENVTPVQARVEHFTTRDFDQIVSRAFAQLATFVELTRPLLAEGGEWLAMKGRDAASELAELPPDVTLIERRDLEVPGDAAQRVLLRLRRA